MGQEHGHRRLSAKLLSHNLLDRSAHQDPGRTSIPMKPEAQGVVLADRSAADRELFREARGEGGGGEMGGEGGDETATRHKKGPREATTRLRRCNTPTMQRCGLAIPQRCCAASASALADARDSATAYPLARSLG
ncbi:unnamed protein product [Prorocentrum cordatum]|uniref:Uncharacterized protein n=1 Tax=Prorocentrum cordatum TaxID=2364126 RepID=A0ABN9WLK1_9DINO|nr:unnamed protein product [Polarella glacialis]